MFVYNPLVLPPVSLDVFCIIFDRRRNDTPSPSVRRCVITAHGTWWRL